MKIKTIKDPMYCTVSILVHDTSHEEICAYILKKYNATGLSHAEYYDGFCYEIELQSKLTVFFIVFYRKLKVSRDLPLIVHESLHLASKILRYVGMEHHVENEEAYCYLQQYLIGQILKAIK